jgi:hypothetical protein
VCTGSMEAAPQGRAGGTRRSRVDGITADELGLPFLFLPPAAFCKGDGLGEPRLGSVVRESQEKGASESLDAQQHVIRLMPRQRTLRAERTGMHWMRFASRLHLIFFRRWGRLGEERDHEYLRVGGLCFCVTKILGKVYMFCWS